jgi:two-component system sensor histidine kinase CpxA
VRSLFGKILLWFIGSVAVTFMVAALVSYVGYSGKENALSNLVSLQLFVARGAWEQYGAPGLKIFTDRIRETSNLEGILTDAAGREVVTGRDYSDAIREGQRRFPLLRSAQPALSRRTKDGKYWWIVYVPRNRVVGLVASPQALVAFAAIALLCYAFALHLTAPLRELEKALGRFGRGDLAARTGSKRKDELGSLARAFDEMAGRIETLMSAERRLLLDISHELRSPLARLNVSVELARSGADREPALNRIQKEADRLNVLVSELLQVTRAEGDPRLLHSEEVRLNELLREVVEDCAVEARAKDCGVEMASAEETTLAADPELLRRAAENVIRNAVRYSPKARPVEVTLASHAGSAVIEVRDHGPGVPEDALDRIFDPFYRVESDRNRGSGGVGLGLAIARRAVELHKGRVSARNLHPGLLVRMEIPFTNHS